MINLRAAAMLTFSWVLVYVGLSNFKSPEETPSVCEQPVFQDYLVRGRIENEFVERLNESYFESYTELENGHKSLEFELANSGWYAVKVELKGDLAVNGLDVLVEEDRVSLRYDEEVLFTSDVEGGETSSIESFKDKFVKLHFLKLSDKEIKTYSNLIFTLNQFINDIRNLESKKNRVFKGTFCIWFALIFGVLLRSSLNLIREDLRNEEKNLTFDLVVKLVQQIRELRVLTSILASALFVAIYWIPIALTNWDLLALLGTAIFVGFTSEFTLKTLVEKYEQWLPKLLDALAKRLIKFMGKDKD